jgi:arginine decarboxylase
MKREPSVGEGINHFSKNLHKKYIWATPSTFKNAELLIPQFSVSVPDFGKLNMLTGNYLTALKNASYAYNSDHTLFSVNGTTASNKIMFRSIKNNNPSKKDCKFLVTRNVHKSIVAAVREYNIDIEFIPPKFDNELGVFLPNTPSEIISELEKHPDIDALLITSPTYEGLSFKLDDIIKKVRDFNSSIIVYVDEAWGSHFQFSETLPQTAMDAGADIAVQSTHKQGGSIQPGSMIHIKGSRISYNIVKKVYIDSVTTSYDPRVPASLDIARYLMENNGEKYINDLIDIANNLKKEFNKIGLKVYTSDCFDKSRIAGKDPTKIIIGLNNYKITGDELADRLLDKNIYVEKAEYNSVIFLVPLQFLDKVNNCEDVIKPTINAIKEILLNVPQEKKEILIPPVPEKAYSLKDVCEIEPERKIRIPINESAGKIYMEDIITYPPGIPILNAGERSTIDLITFIKKQKARGVDIHGPSDESVETILVLNED